MNFGIKKRVLTAAIAALALSFTMNTKSFALNETKEMFDAAIEFNEDATFDVMKRANSLTYDPNFNNLDISTYTTMTKRQRDMLKMKNKHAIADNELSFDPTTTKLETINLWVKPYGAFEDVDVTNIGNVDSVESNSFGLWMGANSGLIELKNGWDAVWGGYVGYNGSHQNISEVSSWQNGGTLGLETMFFKGDFFTGLNANVGASGVRLSNTGLDGDLDFSYLHSGITSKTGYNWELKDGRFIIQPSLTMSYIYAHTFESNSLSTGLGDIAIDKSTLNTVEFEPGIKFIANLPHGWQPYLGVSLVWFAGGKNHMAPWYAGMQDVSRNAYVRYGVGLRKFWNDRFSTCVQAFVRNGGRSGVGVQGVFNIALGKSTTPKNSEKN